MNSFSHVSPLLSPPSFYSVLGLVPVLARTLRPIETILLGTIRTTEVASEVTTEATVGRTTTEVEAEAITNAAITKTEVEEVMAIRVIGRVVVVVVVEEVAVVAGAAGMIGIMTRTTILTAPGGAAHAPVHPGSARAAGAAPATLIVRLLDDPAILGAPATPLGPAPHPHATAAARESPATRMLKTSQLKVRLRSLLRNQMAASLRRLLEANGLTTTQAPNQPAQRLRKRTRLLVLRSKGPPVVALCGKPSAVHHLQQRAPQSLDKRPRSADLDSSQRMMSKLQIRL